MDVYIRSPAYGNKLPHQEFHLMEDQRPMDENQTGEVRMKNATGTLILGIASIPLCFCSIVPYLGVVLVMIGLALPIVAFAISKKEWSAYKLNLASFHEGDAKNMKAGRICALIGLILNGLIVLLIVGVLLIAGVSFAQAMSEYQ
jgi:hypothetical protein